MAATGLRIVGFVIMVLCFIFTLCLILFISLMETAAVALRFVIYGE